jgi:hypothetical protein
VSGQPARTARTCDLGSAPRGLPGPGRRRRPEQRGDQAVQEQAAAQRARLFLRGPRRLGPQRVGKGRAQGQPWQLRRRPARGPAHRSSRSLAAQGSIFRPGEPAHALTDPPRQMHRLTARLQGRWALRASSSRRRSQVARPARAHASKPQATPLSDPARHAKGGRVGEAVAQERGVLRVRADTVPTQRACSLPPRLRDAFVQRAAAEALQRRGRRILRSRRPTCTRSSGHHSGRDGVHAAERPAAQGRARGAPRAGGGRPKGRALPAGRTCVRGRTGGAATARGPLFEHLGKRRLSRHGAERRAQARQVRAAVRRRAPRVLRPRARRAWRAGKGAPACNGSLETGQLTRSLQPVPPAAAVLRPPAPVRPAASEATAAPLTGHPQGCAASRRTSSSADTRRGCILQRP